MIRNINLTGSVSRAAGGLFDSVRRLAQSLQATGMDVQVYGTRDNHTLSDQGQWLPVKAHAFPVVGPAQFGYSPGLRAMLKHQAPALLHTHGLWTYTSVVTRQYAAEKKTPYIISPHGMLDPWAVSNSNWKKGIARFLYEGAHLRGAHCFRALAKSEFTAIRSFGLRNPIALIPNGIDLPEAGAPAAGGPGTAGGGQKSRVAGLKAEGRKVLLYLGRIHPKKGLVNLLRAWAKKGKNQPWVLGIAGWDQGGHEAQLKLLATELGLVWQDVRSPLTEASAPPAVVFLGPQFDDAKADCYRNCDGFILPSFSEGLPMVVLEAWAYGKAVLMTPECNLPAGFERGAALRIEANAESIGSGLEDFFGAPEAGRQLLGENGLGLVREQFVWPVLAREMKRVYEWMLGGGPKPNCVE